MSRQLGDSDRRRQWIGSALIACALFATAPAPVRAEEGDPPGRAARLSDVEGAVSLQPAGAEDWTQAALNRPLTTGDKVWADQGARVEVDLGSLAVRAGASTGFSFLNLSDRVMQLRVTAGTVIVHVRDLQDGETAEVDTPNLALTLERPGDYRVEVSDSGDTTVVKVSSGEALASAGGQTVRIENQQAVSFSGQQEPLSVESGSLGAPDALDGWSAGRERRVADSPSQRYLPLEVTGAADLDDSGQWQETPDYGPVWVPTAVPVGWAPYRYGHWAWVAPWGWTWVDDAPWGYAPFHYGRWTYWDNSWAWVPCPRQVRPVYAPALVGWVGGGVAVGVAAGVGWFPLGPREAFVPAYNVSAGYVRQVNVTNTTIVNTTVINNITENRVTNITYANARIPGAVTRVPRDVFTSAQPVHAHILPVAAGAAAVGAAAALHTSGTPPAALVPQRQSVLGVNAGRPAARPPAPVFSRPVVARTPPPTAPASLDRQIAAMRANGGRPLPTAGPRATAGAAPAAPVRLVRPVDTPTDPRSLAEREHALQSSPLPSAPGSAARAPNPREAMPQSHLRVPSIPDNARPGTPRSDRPTWANGRDGEANRATEAPRPAAPREPPMQRSYSIPDRSEAPVREPPPRVRESAPPQARDYAPPPRVEAASPRIEAPPPRAVERPMPREAPPPRAEAAPRSESRSESRDAPRSGREPR